MNHEELKHYDGRDGRKAYVAVNGKIYDFTGSKLWSGGDHQGAHRAGCDLTDALQKAPHVRAVIERFPVVGNLEAPVVTLEKKNQKMTILVLIGAAILVAAFLAFTL